jgi:hypothetical protein
VVAIKEGEETGLSTRRPFRTAETDIIPCTFDVTEVPKELLSTYISAYVDLSEMYWNEPESRG